MTEAANTAFDWHGNSCGEVVVLIHGLGLNRHMWQWQTPALGTRYRVLTYDLLGHGETPPVAEPSLTLFAEQLKNLLVQEGVQRAAVMGFSLGGMIARRFAMDYPDDLSALGILYSPHARSKAQQAAIEQRVLQVAALGPESTIDAALVRWFSDDYRAAHPEVMALVRGWVLDNDVAVYPGNYRVLAEGVQELIAPSPRIDCQTLVMTGEDDPGQPPEMTFAIAKEIVNAKIVIQSGLRHMALVEAAGACNRELLTFLDAVFDETSVHEI